MRHIFSFLKLPDFAKKKLVRQANFLHFSLLSILILYIFIYLQRNYFSFTLPKLDDFLRFSVVITPIVLLRKKYLKSATFIFIISTWLILTMNAYSSGGFSLQMGLGLILFAIMCAVIDDGYLRNTGFVLCAITAVFLSYFSINGLLPPPTISRPETRSLQALLAFISALGFLFLISKQLHDAFNLADQTSSKLKESNNDLTHEVKVRKIAEEQLEIQRSLLEKRVQERTSELNKANIALKIESQRKDEFLATMSHELRTPLNVILTQSQAMQRQIYGKLNEKNLSALGNIETSSHHLLALINDILDVAKFVSGEGNLTLSPINLQDIVIGTVNMLDNLANKKNINLTLEYDYKVQTVQGNSRRMQQILTNLLSNAIKFTPEHGSIDVIVKGDSVKQCVDIFVKDSGIGISAENQKELFKPFVQVDARLSRNFEGTGLGLALAKQLVELHDGTISLKSAIGKGSCFKVSLPWEEQFAELRQEITKLKAVLNM